MVVNRSSGTRNAEEELAEKREGLGGEWKRSEGGKDENSEDHEWLCVLHWRERVCLF